MSVVTVISDHYLSQWGEPARRAEFVWSAQFRVQVLKWKAEDTDQGVDLYATVGGSAKSPRGDLAGHRTEFVLGLLPGRDEVASTLAALSLYPVRESALDHGHVIPVDGPLWPGTEMNAFMVVRLDEPIVAPVEAPDGSHVEFLQAVPLFESEFRFVRANGAEELLRRWEGADVPFWDPTRAPAPAS